MATEDTSRIWLEVTNVRVGNDKVEIQVKGDRAEREPVWWKVSKTAYTDFDDLSKAYRTLSENLDKKRIVLAGLGPARENGASPPAGQTRMNDQLECTSIRIQYAESAGR